LSTLLLSVFFIKGDVRTNFNYTIYSAKYNAVQQYLVSIFFNAAAPFLSAAAYGTNML